MNPTAIIAEDEGPQRRALSRLLRTCWPELEVVAECSDGTTAIAALERTSIGCISGYSYAWRRWY